MMQGFHAIVLLLAGLGAGPVQVSTVLEPPETPFHRPAMYTVVVDAPADVEVHIPKLEDNFEGMEVRDGGFSTQALEDGRQRTSVSYVLDPVNIKTHVLPPLKVTWGEEGEASTLPMTFRVRALTEAEEALAAQFVDIAPPAALTAPRAHWTVYALGAVLLGAAAIAVFLLVRGRKNIEAYITPPKPWEVARNRLASLAKRELPKRGEFGTYYVDLSAILRFYIEDRFQVHAPDRTTQELLRDVAATKVLDTGQQEFVYQFLRHCDRVKFAKYEPSHDEMDEGLSSVDSFVTETTPEPAPEEAEAA